MMEGLLVWTPATDSRRPRLWKERLTLREARESLVAKSVGQVSLTQLKPMDFIPFEIASTGFLLSPSATATSKWDTQFTHASFTLCPPWLRIHRESVWSRPVTAIVWSLSTSSTVVVPPEESNAIIIIIGAERIVKTNVLGLHLPISISYYTFGTAKHTNMSIYTCGEFVFLCTVLLSSCLLKYFLSERYLPSLSHQTFFFNNIYFYVINFNFFLLVFTYVSLIRKKSMLHNY